MSILKELVKATGEKQKSEEKDQPFYSRLVRSIAEFNDSDWEKLSEQSQEWFNDAAKAVNDGKNIPELDGAGAKSSREKIEPRGSKKGSINKDDNNGENVMKIEDLEEGVEVVIKGKKDKVLAEGEVSAVKKKNIIILNDDGEKIKVPKDKVVSIEVLEESGSDTGEETEVEFDDVEKGDNIKLVTEDEDEVEGIVEKKTKKAITIDGEKYPADEIETIYKVSEEEAEEEEGEETEVEFDDVEKGDNIKLVTEDEDEVEGIVEKKTKKAITIDGEKYPADEIETIYKVSEEAEEEEKVEEEESALNEKQLEALDIICKFPKMKIDKMKDKIKKKGPKIKAPELDEVYEYAHLVIDKLVENGKL